MKMAAGYQEAVAVRGARLIERIAGDQWRIYEDGDAIPSPPASDVPPEVTMRQARLALQAAGKLAAVQTVINGMAEPAKTNTQIWWDYSSTVVRSQPLVAQLGAAIGLTPAGVDDLFKAAALL